MIAAVDDHESAAVEAIVRSMREALQPPPDRSPSQWADACYVLSSTSSAEPGPWRTDRTPYLRGVLDAVGPRSPARRIACMFATQLGKTEALLIAAGFYIDAEPSPIMLVQPTKEAAVRFSRQRITPLVEVTPALRSKVVDAKARDEGNTILAKEFPGGVLFLVGANSPTDLASAPMRILLADEIDRWVAELGSEGDPLRLAERRTATFANRKIVLVSSPTVRFESRVEAEFLQGDQQHFEIPCPRCGVFQRLVWSRVRWPKGKPLAAHYECEGCGEAIANHEKTWMLARGRWQAEDLSVAELLRAEFNPPLVRDPEAVSFRLSTLYSPWFSWGDMASEFVRASRDPVLLRVFTNTLLGETWSLDEGDGTNGSEFLARREPFGAGAAVEVPRAVVVLTAGIDVQADRAVVEVVGWGRGEESWSIDHVEVYGDPSVDPRSGGRLWEGLDRVLLRCYKREGGGELVVEAACIDTGHQSLNCYEFVRPRQKRRLWGVKGKQGDGGRLWPRSPTRRNKGRIDLYVIDTTAAKESVYARLRLTERGPGFCHFPEGRSESYFAELVAEKRTVKFSRGHKIATYTLPNGRRNEALDCRVYAFAALHGWRQGRNTLDVPLDKPKGGREPVKTAPRGPVAEERRAGPVASTGRPGFLPSRRKGWIR